MEQRKDPRNHESTWHPLALQPPCSFAHGRGLGAPKKKIRSVRRVLSTIMTEQVHTSEMLTTLLVIAEGIINSRPLTPASDDPNDLEPLTPNHLLIHLPASVPLGLFNENDLYCRRKWRQVQYLADVSGDDGPRSIS